MSSSQQNEVYFISCVSREFKSYRDALRHALTGISRTVKIQEDFKVGGKTLLEKLDDYICCCDGIIHLVGDGAGANPTPAEVRAILRKYPELPTALPEIAPELVPENCAFSYTQWEAYLSFFHRVDCYIYCAEGASGREPDWRPTAADELSQQRHLQRIKARGKDRAFKPFLDSREVAIDFLNSILDSKHRRERRDNTIFAVQPSRNFLPSLPTNYVVRREYSEQIVDISNRIVPGRRQTNRTCLVTSLTGMPGVGKTLLAIAAAIALETAFPDGQLYINLNGFSDSELPITPGAALDRLLQQIGIRVSDIPFGVPDKAAIWRAAIKNFKGIVLLDNARNTAQIEPITSAETGSFFIITSRNRMPEMFGLERVPVDPMTVEQGRQLFKSFFPALNEPSEADLAIIDSCVHRCGYLPLMIRVMASLWAARARSYVDIDSWLASVAKSDWIFRNSDSDAEFSFNASYLLLTDDERAVFANCAALPGTDFSIERLRSVCESIRSVESLLFQLVDYSLVSEAQQGRYSMHDLLKLFGRRRGREQDPRYEERVRRASLRYFVHYLTQHVGEADSEQNRGSQKSWIAAEISNIVTNCEESAVTEPELVESVITAISPKISELGFNTASYVLNRISLQVAEKRSDIPAIVKAHRAMANALMSLGEFGEAEDHYIKAISAAKSVGDVASVYSIEVEKAFCFERLGKYEDGLDLLRGIEAEIVRQKLPLSLVRLHTTRGAILWRLGRYSEALECFSADPGVSTNDNNMGFTYFKLGQYAMARKYLWRAYKAEQRAGRVNSILVSQVNLAYVYARSRRPCVGLVWGTNALDVAVKAENRFQEARALDALGDVHLHLAQPTHAMSCWQKASFIFGRCHAPEVAEVSEKIRLLGEHSA